MAFCHLQPGKTWVTTKFTKEKWQDQELNPTMSLNLKFKLSFHYIEVLIAGGRGAGDLGIRITWRKNFSKPYIYLQQPPQGNQNKGRLEAGDEKGYGGQNISEYTLRKLSE